MPLKIIAQVKITKTYISPAILNEEQRSEESLSLKTERDSSYRRNDILLYEWHATSCHSERRATK
ncbi:hypothetical protein P700755_000716 [Psychroflexus torquis ATCC 700755]|uniref:Uncharacterized protein n=1 Tax=Psychroflexus torquis (strain ATCC 700755 / CIP 106069 / ACAM 623) TaxID=313595 RepID=K4ICX0_PSYTT|nr:hypothetical protein P700755_000716 [Psychroflexus torquis ATCC 700755]